VNPPRRGCQRGGQSGRACGHSSDGDLLPEGFELVNESADSMFGGVPSSGPVGAEVGVVNVVVDDVPVGDEQVVPGRADRLVRTSSAADAGVVRSQVGGLDPASWTRVVDYAAVGSVAAV
jgi:hypothetical protein